MTTVYLVWGECGEYEDHCDWIAAAFFSKGDASAFCRSMNNKVKKAKDLDAKYCDCNYQDGGKYDAFIKEQEAIDPDFDNDAEYTVRELEVK